MQALRVKKRRKKIYKGLAVGGGVTLWRQKGMYDVTATTGGRVLSDGYDDTKIFI